jgi:hypothetical protein
VLLAGYNDVDKRHVEVEIMLVNIEVEIMVVNLSCLKHGRSDKQLLHVLLLVPRCPSPVGVGIPRDREGYHIPRWHEVIVAGHQRAFDVSHHSACGVAMRGGWRELCQTEKPVIDSFLYMEARYDIIGSRSYFSWKQIICMKQRL